MRGAISTLSTIKIPLIQVENNAYFRGRITKMSLNSTVLTRYYNAPIEQVYSAMKQYLNSPNCDFKLEQTDDLSYSLVFSSGMSLTTWGERISASAVPENESTVIHLTISGKIGTTAVGFQGSHNIKIANDFFAGVSAILSNQQTTYLQQVNTVSQQSLSSNTDGITEPSTTPINNVERNTNETSNQKPHRKKKP